MKHPHYLKTFAFFFCSVDNRRLQKRRPRRPCGVKDPTTELPWLKKEIERYQKDSIVVNYSVAIGTIIYKKERVFWKYDINASDYSPLYRCNGSYFYLPRQNLDKEQQQMLLLMNPSESCLANSLF